MGLLALAKGDTGRGCSHCGLWAGWVSSVSLLNRCTRFEPGVLPESQPLRNQDAMDPPCPSPETAKMPRVGTELARHGCGGLVSGTG